jgi:hypothetical protein
LVAVGGHRSPSFAGGVSWSEIHCVGGENLTSGHATRIPTVAPLRLPTGALQIARPDDSIRFVLIPYAGLRPDPLNHKQMSSREAPQRPPAAATEIALVTGERYHIEGDPKGVERIILDAARGSIMQLAWLVEAETGKDVGINPEYVVTLKVVES